jgi:DNA-binding CsgD family transcriptional regulator
MPWGLASMNVPGLPDFRGKQKLSDLQLAVLSYKCHGNTAKEIGRALGKSPRSVEYVWHCALRRLNITTTYQAVKLIYGQNWKDGDMPATDEQIAKKAREYVDALTDWARIRGDDSKVRTLRYELIRLIKPAPQEIKLSIDDVVVLQGKRYKLLPVKENGEPELQMLVIAGVPYHLQPEVEEPAS